MKNELKLEVLISCMYQDSSIAQRSAVTGDAVVINQCGKEDFTVLPTRDGRVKIYDSLSRGLTVSRNLAIERSSADICLLCDDDERFLPDYRQKIVTAYRKLPQADVIIFKMADRPPSFKDKVMRLRYPLTMKVSSWQISFRRASLIESGVRFDELMGAGTGNGAEEELKFLTDCEKAGLSIYYVPSEIASVGQTSSTWFKGYDEEFFRNRGSTTRYILGTLPAVMYALYYVLAKRDMYSRDISPANALRAILKGIRENKLSRLKKQKDTEVERLK